MATKDHQMSASTARGFTIFGGVLLMIVGAFQALEALSAIVHDQYVVVAPQYIYAFDLTAWGWVHLLVGLGLVAVGIFLLRGQRWAMMAGIVIAAISAVINFTWLPYTPFWAILVIAVDILVIWALASSYAQAKAADEG